MLMLKCQHCGAISDEPTIVEIKVGNYAECKWCGMFIKKLNYNDTMMIKENKRGIREND